MQNRYAGDIGDYGKLGLLRALQASGLSIGVNWYLVPDEKHNSDGRYVRYLNDPHMRRCDEPLWLELKHIVDSEQRSVSALENEQVLKARFFSQMLDLSGKPKTERQMLRDKWYRDALCSLSGLDLVFVDPDNGLLVPSAAGTMRENKYVKPVEIEKYYFQGSSVVYYQHKARKPDSFYIRQHQLLMERIGDTEASGFCVKFKKTSQRFFFFLAHPSHKAVISGVLRGMLSGAWIDCFEEKMIGSDWKGGLPHAETEHF